MKRGRKRKLLALAVLAPFLAILACDLLVGSAGRGRIYSDAQSVPHRRVGVVLGTGRKVVGGRTNLFFKHRMEAAETLFKSGRVDFLLVSGDNGSKYYDEATDMKKDLLGRGVPADRICCDYAGFRTLDSMVRARKVFGLDECIVVSQRFHCERAIFLAGSCDLRALGFAARDVPGGPAAKAWLRERLARVAAVLDVFVWHRQPRFLGAPVRIGPDPSA